MTSSDNTFYARVFGLATAALLGVAAIKLLQPFLIPMVWAGLLGLLIYPMNLRLRRIVRGRKGLAALLLCVLVVLVVVIPAGVLAGVFVSQASALAASLQDSAGRYQIVRPGDVFTIPVIDRVVRWISEMTTVTTEDVQRSLFQAGERFLQGLVGLTGSLFASVLAGLLAVVLTLFMLFFVLRDGETIVERTLVLIPLDTHRKSRLAGHLAAVTKAVVLGSLVTAVVQGMLVGVAFAIAGLPSPIVFAVVSMFASLIPFVGAALVWVPAAIILLVQGHWGLALFLGIWGAVAVSSADNVVRPLFISSSVKLSTMPVFIGLIGGVSAFGAVGMFLGPVLVALILALVEFARETRGAPGATHDTPV
jgi:predicted PurR-regulated permease PerM